MICEDEWRIVTAPALLHALTIIIISMMAKFAVTQRMKTPRNKQQTEQKFLSAPTLRCDNVTQLLLASPLSESPHQAWQPEVLQTRLRFGTQVNEVVMEH